MCVDGNWDSSVCVIGCDVVNFLVVCCWVLVWVMVCSVMEFLVMLVLMFSLVFSVVLSLFIKVGMCSDLCLMCSV